MPRLSACALVFAALTAGAQAQFPLGPGNNPPQQIVDPAINEYICKAVVRHAMLWTPTAENLQVELVSSRWQGELVFCYSRVTWTSKHLWGASHREHAVEVQYSMIQRRFLRRVYDIWCQSTRPAVYAYYDLGRVRTRINEELHRFDEITGDNVFPGPWPRGPVTMVPQIMPPPTPAASTGPKKEGEVVKEATEPPSTIVMPPVIEPRLIVPSPQPQPPPSSTGKDRQPPPRPTPK